MILLRAAILGSQYTRYGYATAAKVCMVIGHYYKL